MVKVIAEGQHSRQLWSINGKAPVQILASASGGSMLEWPMMGLWQQAYIQPQPHPGRPFCLPSAILFVMTHIVFAVLLDVGSVHRYLWTLHHRFLPRPFTCIHPGKNQNQFHVFVGICQGHTFGDWTYGPRHRVQIFKHCIQHTLQARRIRGQKWQIFDLAGAKNDKYLTLTSNTFECLSNLFLNSNLSSLPAATWKSQWKTLALLVKFSSLLQTIWQN